MCLVDFLNMQMTCFHIFFRRRKRMTWKMDKMEVLWAQAGFNCYSIINESAFLNKSVEWINQWPSNLLSLSGVTVLDNKNSIVCFICIKNRPFSFNSGPLHFYFSVFLPFFLSLYFNNICSPAFPSQSLIWTLKRTTLLSDCPPITVSWDVYT